MSGGGPALPGDLAPEVEAPRDPALAERLADLRHDLGKYIVFEARFVEDPADLRDALRADLLETHRRAGVTEPAWGVWARLRPPQLAAHPDVRAIDAAMARLQAADLEAEDADLEAIAADARAVDAATRRLASWGRS